MNRLRRRCAIALAAVLAGAGAAVAGGGPAEAAVPPADPVAIGQSTTGDRQVLATDSDAVGSTVKVRTHTVGLPENVKAQRWTFEVVSPGANPIYRVRQASSGRCLQAAATSNGAAVIIVDCGTASQQFWTLTRAQTWPSVGFALRNQRDGRCLDVLSSTDGQPAVMWACSSSYTTQLWRPRIGGADCPERDFVGLCAGEDSPVSGVMVSFRQQPVSFNGPPADPQTGGYNSFSNQVNWDPLDGSGGNAGYDYEEMGWQAAYASATGTTSHTAYWLEDGEATEEYWSIDQPGSKVADGLLHTWMSLGNGAGQWDMLYDFNPVGTTHLATGGRTRALQTGLMSYYPQYTALATPFENRVQVQDNGAWRRPRLVNVSGFPANVCGRPDPRSILFGEPSAPPYCYTMQAAARASNLPSSPTELDRLVLGKPAAGSLALGLAAPQRTASRDEYNGVDQRKLAACLADDAGRCLETVPGLAACVAARKVCNVTTGAAVASVAPARPVTADAARHDAGRRLRTAGDARTATVTVAEFRSRAGVALAAADGTARVHVVTGGGTVPGLGRDRGRIYRGYTMVYAAATGDLLYGCLGRDCARGGF